MQGLDLCQARRSGAQGTVLAQDRRASATHEQLLRLRGTLKPATGAILGLEGRAGCAGSTRGSPPARAAAHVVEGGPTAGTT